MDFLSDRKYISNTPEETIQIGEEFADCLKTGSVVALHGRLGAGKTVFVRGIAQKLKIKEEITSPSFNIIKEYEGSLGPFYHLDAFRLYGEEDFRLAGGEDLLFGAGICVIEWPERINLPAGVINVEIAILEDGKRSITYGGPFDDPCL
ncbi:MAG: tRNA (adenosine(37)-N6)-threonylcarbamoyltransferase complex ATPase subunit type 1 TsaE [Treponema sp.]|nr:tRNA (adenosine(37)-N6)-threonylcarbamoyltransferase complex ATPase subunit type 1 TsaE [Treponema sp.]